MAVTPAQLRDLVERAAVLAADIAAVREAGRTDENTRRALFRLDEAEGAARGVAAELGVTADDLARLQARPVDACPADWGVCPEHGATLHCSGGRSWCVTVGCGRTWAYDRLGEPCSEPVEFEIRGIGDDPDSWGRLCAGHTRTARDQLDGVQVREHTPQAPLEGTDAR